MSSPASGIPYFGRAYELTITKADNSETIKISSSEWEPEALRFTFEVQQWAMKAFWFAYIKIYNCDGQIQSGPSKGKNLAQTVFSQGDIVTLKAGYQQNGMGIVWIGELFQPILTRENVVDWTLELRCINGISVNGKSLINVNIPALATQQQQFLRIMNGAVSPVPYDPSQLSGLTDVKLPRGKVVFGSALDKAHQLAKFNGMVSWFGGLSVNGPKFEMGNVEKMGSVVASYAPAFSPGSIPQNAPNGVTLSLVGTPQQTINGVEFTVLLDSRMKVQLPWNRVQVDLNAVRETQIDYNPNANATFDPSTQEPGYAWPLPKNGIYIVTRVLHVGDTRGHQWHSHVIGIAAISGLIKEITRIYGNSGKGS